MAFAFSVFLLGNALSCMDVSTWQKGLDGAMPLWHCPIRIGRLALFLST